MQMARPSTAPSMPSRSTKEERESSTAWQAGLSHEGSGGAAKDLGVRET